MWFRSDLRVHDNTALSRACAESDEGVVAVFCVCALQWKDAHDWGDAKAGFVMRNLRALADRLGTLRIPLKIVEVDDFEGVAEALVGVAEKSGCDRLYFNREYEVNELERGQALLDQLNSRLGPDHPDVKQLSTRMLIRRSQQPRGE